MIAAGRHLQMKVAFFGTPEFAVPALDSIVESGHEIVVVVAQPDRPSGRGMKLKPPPVALRAREIGLALEQPKSVRKGEFVETFRSYTPDIAVVVAYGRILPADLLEVPPHGFINIHGSLLPKYRGAAPIQRAIQNGEPVTGVTIMKIDEQLDHGPILSAAKTAIGKDETSVDLFERLASIGAAEIVEALDLIESGDASWTEQDHERATLAPMIEKAEGHTTFEEPAEELFDRWRAFQPWPGIHTTREDETIKLREIAPATAPSVESRPGSIVSIDETSFTVACEVGAIEILRAQRPGRVPVTGTELLTSLGMGVGDLLPKERTE